MAHLTALPADIPPSGATQAGRLYLPCHHEDHPEQWGVAKPQVRSLDSKAEPGLIHLFHQHLPGTSCCQALFSALRVQL